MRLRQLYSNKPEVFQRVPFNAGLSVIVAEIRVPANRLLDTHNLGKTTVGELIDFCLLKGKSSGFFLFKREDVFSDFVFYLEIELPDGSFLTIGRPVTPGSRIAFKRTSESLPDATQLAAEEWDHLNLAFDKAKLVLDGILGIDELRPWGFRKLVGYLIRSQGDYQDVFQLGKFSGKHQDWKPFVAHLLGLDAAPVIDLYDKREELVAAGAHLQSLTREWGTETGDPSVLDGLISVKKRDVEAKSAVLESFNFADEDGRITADVVEQVEQSIASSNEERYRLVQLVSRLEDSLREQRILFRPSDAERLFKEAGIAFGEQLKRDYSQLVEFNRAVTEERRQALEGQLSGARGRLVELDAYLGELNQRRAGMLEFLRESESLAKYKALSRELTDAQAELNTLEARRAAAARLLELRREYRQLSEDFGHLETAVEQLIEDASTDEDSRFGRIRRYFTEIVFEVLGQNAILAIAMNGAGGLEFTAEFVGESGTATSGDKGTSYRKLLCIAFDLAFLRAYGDISFPRFAFHDGAFEQLESRKRENLLAVFRSYASYGLQPIVTALDSDMPELEGAAAAPVGAEIVLTLHDEGEDGRLFRMPAW